MQKALVFYATGLLFGGLTVCPTLAIDNIGFTNLVWLQGVNFVETSGGFRNEGVLRLETVDDSYTILLVVNGTIVNAPSGLVEINQGAGGARGISADWLNDGEFIARYGVNLSKTNGLFEQNGSFRVATNALVYSDSLDGIFDQNSGTLSVEGTLRLRRLTFNYNGGEIRGSPILFNADLHLGAGASNVASFVFNGPESHLANDLPPDFWVAVQGDFWEGPAALYLPREFQNGGTIVLSSTNFTSDAALVSTNGAFTNLAGGTIRVELGYGGERAINADVVNFGKLELETDLTINSVEAGFQNSGEVNLGTDLVLTVSKAWRQDADGTLVLNLSEPNPSFDFEKLSVTGLASFDGTLSLQIAPGVNLVRGKTFKLAAYGSRNGRFKTLLAPPLPEGLVWRLDYTANGLAAVIGNPADEFVVESTRLDLNGNFNTVATGGGSGILVLQTSTDLIEWTNVQTNDPFTGSLDLTLPATADSPHRFYRFRRLP
jgi:hypothetical protein